MSGDSAEDQDVLVGYLENQVHMFWKSDGIPVDDLECNCYVTPETLLVFPCGRNNRGCSWPLLQRSPAPGHPRTHPLSRTRTKELRVGFIGLGLS